MKHVVLPLALCLVAASQALAQSDAAAPRSTAPAETGSAPASQSTAVNAPPADNGAATAKSDRGPNLCAELSTYVEKERNAADPQMAGGGNPATSTAVQAPNKPSEQPKVGGQDEPQKQSGLSAPVTHEAGAAAGPQGVKPDEPAQKSAGNQPPKAPPKATPAPGEVPKAPKPDQASLQQAQAAISAGDQLGCRAAVQKMRRQGVAMPPPLLALGALDPKLLQTGSTQPGGAQPNGAGATGAGP